jgi:hexosaminidase
MTDIVQFASNLGVNIIPSLDMPGHALHIINAYNQVYTVYTADIGLYGADHETVATVTDRVIDITQTLPRQFMMNLYEEFMNFFKNLGCKYFNIGFDEIINFNTTAYDPDDKFPSLGAYANTELSITDGNAYDAFVHTMNEVAKTCESKGMQALA